jgi:nicotinamidase/pyrazinamidase
MAGTPGQQKIPETLLAKRYVVPNQPIEVPGLRQFQQVILEKQAFGFQTNPNADTVLRQLPAESMIALYGVATEICVAAAALALLAAGRKGLLVRDAVARSIRRGPKRSSSTLSSGEEDLSEFNKSLPRPIRKRPSASASMPHPLLFSYPLLKAQQGIR